MIKRLVKGCDEGHSTTTICSEQHHRATLSIPANTSKGEKEKETEYNPQKHSHELNQIGPTPATQPSRSRHILHKML